MKKRRNVKVGKWVNVYKDERKYGGPEEGGWYYTEAIYVLYRKYVTGPSSLARALAYVKENFHLENTRYKRKRWNRGSYDTLSVGAKVKQQYFNKPSWE